jgi:hypothetical protein
MLGGMTCARIFRRRSTSGGTYEPPAAAVSGAVVQLCLLGRDPVLFVLFVLGVSAVGSEKEKEKGYR